MSVSTIEKVDASEVSIEDPRVKHHIPPAQLFRKMRGLVYQTGCGLKRGPNPSFSQSWHGDELSPMEKCVVCEMLRMSHE